MQPLVDRNKGRAVIGWTVWVCVCVLEKAGQKPAAFIKEVPKKQHQKGSAKDTIAMTMCGNFGKIQWTTTAGPKHCKDAAQCSAGILILCAGLCSAGRHLPRASCNMSFFLTHGHRGAKSTSWNLDHEPRLLLLVPEMFIFLLDFSNACQTICQAHCKAYIHSHMYR